MNTFAEEIIARSARKNSVEVVAVAPRELYAELFHLYERDKHRGSEWLILHRSELIIGKLPDGTTWRVEIIQIDDDGEPILCGMDWC